MKAINILSLVQAHNSLDDKSYRSFLSHYDIKIKDNEVGDLSILVNILDSMDGRYIFNGYYVSYSIPQISNEFDLLRFGNDSIINIELKSESSIEKIEKQLYKKKYYLKSLNKKLHNFLFISKTRELYFINPNNQIQSVDLNYLKQILDDQDFIDIGNIDNYFNPKKYLVSPFNSTDKFVEGEYFLTNHQEEIKKEVINSVASTRSSNFISITGGPGTGKTLLVYDIAKEMINTGNKVLIIHGGNLNEGQYRLINSYKWTITPIKKYSNYDLSSYYLIIIDEAQRLRNRQLNEIVCAVQKANNTCVLSYDRRQILANWEKQENMNESINSIDSITAYKLTNKIRTNKEIASFIGALFDNKKNSIYDNRNNIELNYFEDIDDARIFLKSLANSDWELIQFTPSQYDSEFHEKYSSPFKKSSHGVIGQEFENVAVVIDQYFFYSDTGKLNYKGKIHYDAPKMLFQNITRTINKLNIIVINNQAILDRCLTIIRGGEIS